LLSYFRINDPYRLVIIFVIVVLLRLPYMLDPSWLTVPELKWMLLGEKLNGGAMLYADILDNTAPLSALAYRLLNLVAGRSPLAMHIAGTLVYFFQIFFINFIALRHKMYNESNYLPALFYGILGFTTFNMMVLSPAMMGMTFVLLSINHLLAHVESRNRTDANLINIGLFSGLATLFYMPFLFTFFIHAFVLVLFTNTLRRRYLLMLYGLLVPVAVAWMYYLWRGEVSGFYQYYLLDLARMHSGAYLGFRALVLLFGFAILLYVLASFRVLAGLRFTVFQLRIQKTVFAASIIMLVIWLLYSDRGGYLSIVFLPWASFFLAHFFLSIRRTLQRELAFFVYIAYTISIYLALAFNLFGLKQQLTLDSLLVDEKATMQEVVEGKGIWVVGPDIQPYKYARVASPYFNWNLCRDQFFEISSYEALQGIDRNIRADMPELIIDQIGLVPLLFEKMPLISAEYVLLQDGVYERRLPNN
jgi:hypothetical protein